MATKKKSKGEKKELAQVEPEMLANLDVAMQIFQENISEVAVPGQVGMGVLPRISLKHAGTVGFGMERVDQEEEELVGGKDGFDAVILYAHPVRVYWEQSFDEREGEELPTCSSLDAITGMMEGQAPRACIGCEFAQWGTALGGEGRGQACRQRTRMFVLPEEEIVPHLLEVPTTSLQVPQKYAVALASKRLRTHAVVTHFGAVGAKNRDNVAFSRLELTLRGVLPTDAVERLQPLREAVMVMAVNIPIISDDTSESPTPQEGKGEDGTEDIFPED